jgi:glycine dehydrogenase
MTNHASPSLRDLEHHSAFVERHIGPNDAEITQMLGAVGYDSLDAMTHAIVPGSIRSQAPLALPEAITEVEALAKIRAIAGRNQVFRSFIGQGYYGTHTPNVILRNILENPAWYTAYTPYQAEISQGRMEALINFQTMVADLTGMEIANASLLDEATAAAEAMTLAKRSSKSKSSTFFVADDVHPQTLAVLRTRAEPLGIELQVGADVPAGAADAFGALLQYPGTFGGVRDYQAVADAVHARGGILAVAADLLALTLLTPPGEFGADIVIGNSQRFGVPLGFGGPHAGFMALPRRLQAPHAGPSDRRLGRRRRASPPTACPADARAAHPPREGDLQHLHRAGAARGDGRDVRRLPRARRAARASPAARTAWPRSSPRRCARPARGRRRRFFDTPRTSPAPTRPSVPAPRDGASTCAGRRRPASASRSTRRPRAPTSARARAFGVARRCGRRRARRRTPDALPASLRRQRRSCTHPVFNTHHSETEMLRYCAGWPTRTSRSTAR